MQSVQSVQSVVSWGIKGPEEAEGVEDVEDTCRYERYAGGREGGRMDVYKTEKPQLHAEASVIGVATTYFPTS